MAVKRVIPNIRSGNPADGQEFYTDVLGLAVVMDMGWIVTFGSPENPTAQLTVVDSDPALPHPDYSVEVADVAACYRAAQEQGERFSVRRRIVPQCGPRHECRASSWAGYAEP